MTEPNETASELQVDEGARATLDYTGEPDTDPVCWAILEAFNPPDDDAAFESIVIDAVERAAQFIEAQPCKCDRTHEDKYELGADGCERCQVLGRIRDETEAR
jgi:hypothetical protein